MFLYYNEINTFLTNMNNFIILLLFLKKKIYKLKKKPQKDQTTTFILYCICYPADCYIYTYI